MIGHTSTIFDLHASYWGKYLTTIDYTWVCNKRVKYPAMILWRDSHLCVVDVVDTPWLHAILVFREGMGHLVDVDHWSYVDKPEFISVDFTQWTLSITVLSVRSIALQPTYLLVGSLNSTVFIMWSYGFMGQPLKCLFSIFSTSEFHVTILALFTHLLKETVTQPFKTNKKVKATLLGITPFLN